MERTAHYEQYLQILREELIPAMGCTEPVAIALAAAKAREALGAVPERCRVEVSGNIIKNVKAVTVPNTGGLKGIEAAAAAGMAAGRPDLELEVLSRITPEEIPSIHAMLDQCAIRVHPSTGDRVFFINVTVAAGEHTACCEIVDFHTNIVIAFADCLDPADVAEVLGRQVACNSAISAEGLKGGWGAEIGRTLRSLYGDDVSVRARAAAAAGSDARMSGCEMPVVIVSGSGAGGVGPGDDPPEDRHRPPVRLLRRGQCRMRRGGGHRLSAGRTLRGHRPHHRQYPGHLLGHDLRRGQALLRRQDCLGGGCGPHGLSHVPAGRPPVCRR